MKKIIISVFIGAACILLLGFKVDAQVSLSSDRPLTDENCPGCFIRSAYPTKLVTPYIDLLLGFSTFYDFGRTNVGIASEIRGGLQVARSMLIGTGLSVLTMDGYEMGVVIPLELGYRTKNKNFDFVSSIGYSYLLYEYYLGLDDVNSSGRTLSVDAYWRPRISRKGLRAVVAAGGMLYDYGNLALQRCPSCGIGTGPRYTFRLRAGLGF